MGHGRSRIQTGGEIQLALRIGGVSAHQQDDAEQVHDVGTSGLGQEHLATGALGGDEIAVAHQADGGFDCNFGSTHFVRFSLRRC